MPHFHILIVFSFLLLSVTAASRLQRQLLHQPLLSFEQNPSPGATAISQPPSSSPSSQPQPQQPNYPFTTLPPPVAPTTIPESPFFPDISSPPLPPPPPISATAFATFPANISSLVLPSSPRPSHKPTKLISLIVAVSFFSVLVFTSVVLLLLRHRRHHYHEDKSLKSDSLRLFPPNTTPSDTSVTTTGAPVTTDASKKPPPQLFPRHAPSSTSSEFLYLGTLVSSRDPENYAAPSAGQNDGKAPPPPPSNYQRLGSPELQPLPPLPRQHSGQIYHNTPHAEGEEENSNADDGDELFFSPKGSTANNTSPFRTRSSTPQNNTGSRFHKTGNLNPFACNSPVYSISPDNSPSVALNSESPQSMLTKSPDSSVIFPAPLPRFIPPPPARQPRAFPTFSPSSTDDCATRDCSPRASDFSSIGKVTPSPPPPPPPPPPVAAPPTGPPELVAPSRKVVLKNLSGEQGSLGNLESKSEEMMKPKLKPLHWDKVRASSDKSMVWDQLKSSSFQLNEEMIETLFTANASTMNAKDGLRRQMMPEMNQENLVLDPKKSQNIAILLRALNVTVHEVCEAILEGNADTLSSELLESLLKMAPTIEEERKLMELNNDSPLKLGTAEAFLKAVLSIPFAFKRVDAMLYVANFESEVKHLKRSFDTLELACKELKSSRMFMKLLEAVLKTGNRMNNGTNRGDAQAFKLDTLLKLADVKGADGKTTLLHFVVQEIIHAEGARSSKPALQNEKSQSQQQSTLRDEVELKKIGLQVVSGLSGELSNVKKAAGIDSDSLVKDVQKLVSGIHKVREALEMGGGKFSENMTEFLKKAEVEIENVRMKEGVAFSMVKGLTEYFHGDSGSLEARPLRLFMVVRDFLVILDRVCKDAGRINERARVNSGQQVLQGQANVGPGPNAPVFPGFSEGRQSSSSDDESSCSF